MGSPDASQPQGGLFSPPGRRSGLPPRPVRLAAVCVRPSVATDLLMAETCHRVTRNTLAHSHRLPQLTCPVPTSTLLQSPGLKRQPSAGALPAVAKQTEAGNVVHIRIASPVVAEPRQRVPRQHHHAKTAVEAPPVQVAGRVLDFSSPPDKDKDKDKCGAAKAECPKPMAILPGVLGFFSPTPKGGPPPAVASPEVILALGQSEKTQLQQVLDAKMETADALRQLADERAGRMKAEQAAAAAQCDTRLAEARVCAAEKVAADAKLAVQSAAAVADKLRVDLEACQQQMRAAVEEAAVARAALMHKEVETETALFTCRELEVDAEEATVMRACARQLRTGLHALLAQRGVTPKACTADAMADCMEALKAVHAAAGQAACATPGPKGLPAADVPKKPAAAAQMKNMAARDVQEILKRPWGRAPPPARTPSATPRQEAPRLRAERSAPCLSYRSAMQEEEDCCDDDMPAVTGDGAPRSAVKARRALGAFNISALDLRTTPHKARTPGRQGTPGAAMAAGQENVCFETGAQQACTTPGSSLRMLGGAARVEVRPGSLLAAQLAASAVPCTPKPDWTTRW